MTRPSVSGDYNGRSPTACVSLSREDWRKVQRMMEREGIRSKSAAIRKLVKMALEGRSE